MANLKDRGEQAQEKNDSLEEKVISSSETHMGFFDYINRPKSKEEQERCEELYIKYLAEKDIIDKYNFKVDVIALFRSCGWLIDKYDGSIGVFFIRYRKQTYDCPRAYFNKLTKSINFVDPNNKYGGTALITPFELYVILKFKGDKSVAVESLRIEEEINRKKRK